MGSSSFMIPTIDKLLRNQYHIVAVYTKPPSYSGRGLLLNKNEVHIYSVKNFITVLTPDNLNQSIVLENFKSLNPDIVIVAGYGMIIPKDFLSIPKYGFINVHPSDLPKWRGASPIERTIISGEKKTALCIIKIDEGLDTGDIILKKDIMVDSEITGKELRAYCAEVGSMMIIDTLKLFELEKVQLTKQSNKNISFAKKITVSERLINFNLTAQKVNSYIRALSPKPGAHFLFNGTIIKIIKANVKQFIHTYEPGTIINNRLGIACKQYILEPTLLQREGKKILCTSTFLQGFEIKCGSKL